MRKFAQLVLLLFAGAMAHAQAVNIIPVPVAPSGQCPQNIDLQQVQLRVPNGTFYTCQNGVWAVLGGSGGLSGMTAGQVPIAATASTVTSSKAIQGTDTNLLSSGTVSGTGASLCTDANGGATTTGCTAGGGLSGMTTGQIPVAASATTVTSSKALAGSGAAISTGPATSTSTDIVNFSGTSGQLADSTVALSATTMQFPGAANINAGGTNQNVTLLPSGTGTNVLQSTAAGSSQKIASFWDNTGQEQVYITNARLISTFSTGSNLSLGVGGLTKALITGNGLNVFGAFNLNTITPAFSATPAFAVNTYGIFEMTLTGNVTSFTLTGTPSNGTIIKFIWHQDATGGWTVSGAPANMHGFTTPGTTLSTTSIQSCTYISSAWYCEVANTNIP